MGSYKSARTWEGTLTKIRPSVRGLVKKMLTEVFFPRRGGAPARKKKAQQVNIDKKRTQGEKSGFRRKKSAREKKGQLHAVFLDKNRIIED